MLFRSDKENIPRERTDPTDANTTIEFLLFSLISKMKLKYNQALSLLANSNTLLIHVIIKGLKGDFEPVVDWYKELFLHCDILVKLFETDPEGLISALHVLDIMKAGLYSKSLEVANWALRLMSKTASEMNYKKMSGVAWDWFTSENGGLQVLLSSIRKSKELINENLVSVLCQFGRYNFMELFTHNMKLVIEDQRAYMEVVIKLLEPLADYKLSRDELYEKGVIAFWIDFACRKADVTNSDVQERSIALILLVEIWQAFPTVVEEKAEFSDLIIRLLQRANRDKYTALQICSVALLFRLLQNFAMDRNPFALMIYKTLTFTLVENHQKMELREFLLENFKEILEEFNTIPINILVEPLIKQIRSSDGITFSFNIFDFEFMQAIARHPKLTIKNAIQTLDLLAKPYIYSQTFASCAIYSFLIISNRFKSHPSFESFIQQLIKVI